MEVPFHGALKQALRRAPAVVSRAIGLLKVIMEIFLPGNSRYWAKFAAWMQRVKRWADITGLARCERPYNPPTPNGA
jgi:hypothetical protein